MSARNLHRCHRIEVLGVYFKPEACATMRGAAPGSAENEFPEVTLEFSARGRSRPSTQARRVKESRGVQSDPDGCWRVKPIVGIRKLKSGGVMVEVEWAGGHGEEQIEEVRLGECSVALRRAAREVLPTVLPKSARKVSDSAPTSRGAQESEGGQYERHAQDGVGV